MNYFEVHVGDDLKETAHLTLVEEGVRARLLRRYYDTEAALPGDLAECYRLARASSKVERDAVKRVLVETFSLCEDGRYHHRLADEGIARFKDKQVKARRSAEVRWAGQRAPAQDDANAHANAHANGYANGYANVMPPVRATSPQTPDPSPQSPESESQNEGTPSTPAPTSRKSRKPNVAEVTLAEWLDAVQAKGEKAIPPDDPVFGYAEQAGIPREFLHLAWAEFKARYTAAPVKGQRPKTYVDWRAVFRKAVRENWLKLWFLDGQQYALTTVGQQAQRVNSDGQSGFTQMPRPGRQTAVDRQISTMNALTGRDRQGAGPDTNIEFIDMEQ